MADGVPPRADGTVRPMRCRSASSFQRKYASGAEVRGHVGIALQQTPPALVVQGHVQCPPRSVWQPCGQPAVAAAGVAAPSTPFRRQLVNDDTVAVGTGLQAARAAGSGSHRKQLVEVIHADLLKDHNHLTQAISHGAIPELPPGFSKSLSPRHPQPAVVLQTCTADPRTPPSANLVVEGTSPKRNTEIKRGKTAWENAQDPYLCIMPLCEWLLQSPLLRSISPQFSAEALEACKHAQGRGSSLSKSAGKRMKPSVIFRELQELGRSCQLPMPMTGCPEELKIWAMKLHERVGPRKWAAFHRRVFLRDKSSDWHPSRVRAPTVAHTPQGKWQPTSEEDQQKPRADARRLYQSDPVPSVPSTPKNGIREQSPPEKEIQPEPQAQVESLGESDNEAADGDSRVDDVPVRRELHEEDAAPGRIGFKAPDSPESPVGRRRAAEEYQVRQCSGDSHADGMLFRIKDRNLGNVSNAELLPRAPLGDDLEDSDDGENGGTGTAVGTAAASIGDQSLAARFRRGVAEAWEPSNIQAILKRENAKNEDVGTKKSYASLSIDVDVSSDAVAQMVSALVGETESADVALEEGLNKLIRRRKAVLRRDHYGKRLQANCIKNTPGNRKWPQRIDACQYSLRGLDALGAFASYMCPPDQLASTYAVV